MKKRQREPEAAQVDCCINLEQYTFYFSQPLDEEKPHLREIKLPTCRPLSLACVMSGRRALHSRQESFTAPVITLKEWLIESEVQ